MQLAHITNKPANGYWCVCCQRLLTPMACEEIDADVYIHDNVPHPEEMTFDEEERPQ